jgi:hypothetical protein
MGITVASDLFGGALGKDAAAAVTALGTEIDDPIGLSDKIKIVLDDDHGVTGINQALEDFDEPFDVGHM